MAVALAIGASVAALSDVVIHSVISNIRAEARRLPSSRAVLEFVGEARMMRLRQTTRITLVCDMRRGGAQRAGVHGALQMKLSPLDRPGVQERDEAP